MARAAGSRRRASSFPASGSGAGCSGPPLRGRDTRDGVHPVGAGLHPGSGARRLVRREDNSQRPERPRVRKHEARVGRGPSSETWMESSGCSARPFPLPRASPARWSSPVAPRKASAPAPLARTSCATAGGWILTAGHLLDIVRVQEDSARRYTGCRGNAVEFHCDIAADKRYRKKGARSPTSWPPTATPPCRRSASKRSNACSPDAGPCNRSQTRRVACPA